MILVVHRTRYTVKNMEHVSYKKQCLAGEDEHRTVDPTN